MINTHRSDSPIRGIPNPPTTFSSFDRSPKTAAEELFRLTIQMNQRTADYPSLLKRGITIMNSVEGLSKDPKELLHLSSNYFHLHSLAILNGSMDNTSYETAFSLYEKVYTIAKTNGLIIPCKVILARLKLYQLQLDRLKTATLYLENIETHTAANSFSLASTLREIAEICPSLQVRIEKLLSRESYNSRPIAPSLPPPPSYQEFAQAEQRQSSVVDQLASTSAEELCRKLELLFKNINEIETLQYTDSERTHIFERVKFLYDQFMNPEDRETASMRLNLSAQFLRFYTYFYHFPEEQEKMFAIYDDIACRAYALRKPIPAVAVRSIFHVCPLDIISDVLRTYIQSLQLDSSYPGYFVLDRGVETDLKNLLEKYKEQIPPEVHQVFKAVSRLPIFESSH